MHVVTVNDYLAEYQSDLMGRVYRFLGLTSGCISANQTPAERREQYAADITYGTNNEFGFDYLRDNMAWDKRGAGPARPPLRHRRRSRLDPHRRGPHPAHHLRPGPGRHQPLVQRVRQGRPAPAPTSDYEVDEKKRTVGVLEAGIEKVEDYLGIHNLYESANTPLIGFLNNAIKAKELFKRDKDYVILDGEVLIVDEHTGRILLGRRYNEGMHQAIEAKEGVEIKAENQTLATVTLQNYFRMYDKLSGHDRYGRDRGRRVHETYKLGVVPIPTNRDDPRSTSPTSSTRTRTPSSTPSSRTSPSGTRRASRCWSAPPASRRASTSPSCCAKHGVPHEVLNAKNHAREAAIVAQAGRKGAVTVATNMAGRGTDIMLGGNAEFIAVARTAQARPRPGGDPGGVRGGVARGVRRGKQQVEDEHEEGPRASAASTCSAPNGTSPAASTTSCAAVPAARATRASPGSTSRSPTT